MKLLLVTKQGSSTVEDSDKLRQELQGLGYEVIHHRVGSMAQVHSDIRIEALPERSSFLRWLFG